MPLSVAVSGANTHDMRLVEETLENVVVERPDPERVKQHLCLDKGYDYEEVRQVVEEFGYRPHIKSRGDEEKARKSAPKYRARRWVVERTHSWINRFRRLLIRWEKNVDNYAALVHFACAYICLNTSEVFG